MKKEIETRNQHYNRIKEIIENSENAFKDLKAISLLIANFEKLFGQCQLLERLKEKQILLINKLEQ